MTITDIGILLIVLCVLLWAIMAALHRHTVQLSALQKQIEKIELEKIAPGLGAAREETSPGDEPVPMRPERSARGFSETSQKH